MSWRWWWWPRRGGGPGGGWSWSVGWYALSWESVCVCVPQCVCVTQRGVSLYGVTMRVCLFFQLSERVCVIVSEEGVLLE
jgi:hypothetical protein